ncbi:serine protease, S9A family peptidase [Nitzschia inconspicua]|uniref:Serine protease, S9A family peptidase n=1 Tax=Nitzschia inconspicua TaxID=303405 RepID=A0A9K3PRC0_9STRA|nr:serine protease, S9A family peptidase [Nitzschia inconspicua]KAG7356516.1 serine protease, S9A family peptidase [Nitzschia inconspicua]
MASSPQERLESADDDDSDDPYIGLEQDSDATRRFVMEANKFCLSALGDPTLSPRYKRVLQLLESDNRIPFVSKMGCTEDGDDELYNLWKDAKHPRGLWRKTTLSSYETDKPEWKTVLDLDALSKTENTPWLWRGSRVLPRGRDPLSENQRNVTRVLICLSIDGNENETGVVVREFDLLSCEFVQEKESFSMLQPANTRINYRTRDTVYVGSDFGEGSLTIHGFPRTIRLWQRGTDLKDATIIFEGESSDITVAAYINDQRPMGGNIFEVRTRIIGPRVSKHWVKKIKYEQLLNATSGTSDFKELQVPSDAEIDFVGNVLLVTLRSDWSPEKETKFKKGSLIYVNSHKFLKYGPADRIYHVLFEPKGLAVCNDFIVTKQFLILSISECFKLRLEFYKLEKDGNKLRLVYKDEMPEPRTINLRAVDPCDGDKFWLTTSSFTEPQTLWLADASQILTSKSERILKTGTETYIEKKLKSLSSHFDSSNVIVTTNVAKSKDGTAVPYFTIFKKEISGGKRNPTLLQGFGTLNNGLSPSYAALPGLAWIELGGVYVETYIRGARLGDDCQAFRDDIQNAINDFLAVAEDLVSSKVCNPKTLAIRGGSEGSLVVTNAYIRRPDLFAAVSSHSSLIDLKRMAVLGCSDQSNSHLLAKAGSKEWEKCFKEFSPFHNIDRSKKKYPPVLFTTTEIGSTEHPGHSRKMVKKLWNEGLGRKWPAFYFESSQRSATLQEQYAFVTILSYEFLFKKVARSTQTFHD